MNVRRTLLGSVILGAALLLPAGAAGAAQATGLTAAKPAVSVAAAKACKKECKEGFRVGYRDGYADCLANTDRNPRSRRGFGDWVRGYELGYERGFHAC
ncbi:hypothetical protein C1I98_36385 [Spongiactinospora gelatinilytica]|uniref:Uncharacterized protein n=1 Tax=Spongiactinospora gelatinilytica TaxID=2666298 RepID=A0A2W2EKF8_9ACTN|nr:hypothetical protein [Spongiactinospora gelatinilytica]PZG23181.1 hypothetical protein C1I98_36385 [Spongiactinospora gelatinilytica]